MFLNLLVGSYLVICFFLIIIILLQAGKGGGMGAAFGGAGSSTVLGGSGGAGTVGKITWWASALFMLLSIMITVTSGARSKIKNRTDKTPPVWTADAALTFTEVTPNSMKVAWTSASDNRGVTDYFVVITQTNDETRVREKHITADDDNTILSEVVVEDLQPETDYSVVVTARDAQRLSTEGPKGSQRTTAATEAPEPTEEPASDPAPTVTPDAGGTDPGDTTSTTNTDATESTSSDTSSD
ncbi:MAG: preprotein translocase subunit SecG [Myxococcales bacterium]|nr:preprotein translocase subunit SecG [Myxococcales bacterium]